MKKILIVVVSVVLIALLALPLVGAYKTEQVFNNWLAQVNQMGAYELAWERYDKGWLQTHAVLKVGFKPGAAPAPFAGAADAQWYLPLHVELNHGPVLWLDNLRLGWFSGEFFLDEKHQMWLERNLQKQGEGHFFVSAVHMNLAGQTTLRDRSLPFTLVTAAGETIQVSGYTGEGVVTRTGKVEYNGRLPAFTTTGGEMGQVSVEDVQFRFQSDFGAKAGEYVTPGYGEISVKKVLLKGEEELSFGAADWSMSSDMQLNADRTLANIKLKAAFDDMEVMGEKISAAKLDFAFTNISVAFLNQYLDLIQDSYKNGGENNPMLAMQAMSMASQQLIPGGPQVHVDTLTFTTREGSLHFDGHLMVAPEAAQHVSNPLAMLSHLTIDASLMVDKPLAFRLVRESTMNDLNAAQFEGGNQMTDTEKEALADNQTHMKLDMLTLQGMLMDKGEQYSSEFQFKSGQAQLNGQALPLPF